MKLLHFDEQTQCEQCRPALRHEHRFVEQVDPEVQLQHQSTFSGDVTFTVFVSCTSPGVPGSLFSPGSGDGGLPWLGAVRTASGFVPVLGPR